MERILTKNGRMEYERWLGIINKVNNRRGQYRRVDRRGKEKNRTM